MKGSCPPCRSANLEQPAAHPSRARKGIGAGLTTSESGYRPGMIILGLILLILGLVLSIPILTTIGVVLLIVGVVLYILGAMGNAVGGRSHYW